MYKIRTEPSTIQVLGMFARITFPQVPKGFGLGPLPMPEPPAMKIKFPGASAMLPFCNVLTPGLGHHR